ncbi:MAG: polysaccharide biosynthesis protein [Nitrospinota bacterium]
MTVKLCLVAIDSVSILSAYLLSFLLRFDFTGMGGQYAVISRSFPLLLVITLLTFVRMGMYSAIWKYASIDSVLTTVKAVGLSLLLFVFCCYFSGMPGLPRSIFVIYFFVFLVISGGIRLSVRVLKGRFYRRSQTGIRLLIYGAGSTGEMVAREMVLRNTLGYTPVCFVDDDPKKRGKKIHNLPIFNGGPANLGEIVRKNSIDTVLIAIPSASGSRIRKIVEKCDQLSVKIKIFPGLAEIVHGRTDVQQIRDIKLDDLLKRSPTDLDKTQIKKFVKGKSVLITGAGGSIGSELSSLVAKCAPKVEMLVENSEHSLFQVETRLKETFKDVGFHSILESVTEPKKIEQHLARFETDIIFHSAAYKHVPLVELNPCEAILNNVFGTVQMARLADRHRVTKFVQISTDKAVRPTSVMGATKRVCELYIQNFNKMSATEFVAVRFGNVLNSSGSVIPHFLSQISKGGPVTVTHPEITRYFMLIPEAVHLIMQAASIGKGGEIFILDMGDPVKILDMAKDLIRMMGKVPGEDIEIDFVGLRPGEKLYEELLISKTDTNTKYKSITVTGSTEVEWSEFSGDIERLLAYAVNRDVAGAIHVLKKLVPEFLPQNEVYKEVLKMPFDSCRSRAKKAVEPPPALAV